MLKIGICNIRKYFGKENNKNKNSRLLLCIKNNNNIYKQHITTKNTHKKHKRDYPTSAIVPSPLGILK